MAENVVEGFRRVTQENAQRTENLEAQRAAKEIRMSEKMSKDIRDLTDKIEKSSGDDKKLLQAQLAELQGLQRESADRKARDAELKNLTANALGISQRRFEQAKSMREDNARSREQLNELGEQLKANGVKLDGSTKAAKNYQKLDLELKRKERASERKAMPIGSALVELGKDQAKALGNALKPYLGKGSFIVDKLSGIGSNLKQKVTGGIDTLFGVLKKGLFIASIGALIAFFNSDAWMRLKDKLVPALAKAFEGLSNFMKDLPEEIDNIVKAFEEGGFFAGIKRIAVALGLVKDDVNEAAKEAEGFGLREFGITAGILLLGRGLASIGRVITGAASSLMVATGATKLKGGGVGKAVGLKEGQKFTSKSGQKFQVGKTGEIMKVGKGGALTVVKDQAKILGQLADEGALPKATAGKITKLGKGALKTLSFLRGLPLIGQALAINDIIQLIMAPGSPSEKVDDLAGLIGGIGGTSLGAVLGAVAGSIFPLVGNFIGGGIGALVGYFGGKTIAQGLAQYMLGMQVDAFPDLPFLPNFNDILNNRAAEKRKEKEINEFQATLPSTGTFGVTTDQFDSFQASIAKKSAMDDRVIGSLLTPSVMRSENMRQKAAKTILKKFGEDALMRQVDMGKLSIFDLPTDVRAKALESAMENFSGEGMGGNLNVYNAGGDTITNMSKTVTPRFLQDQDTATRAGTLSLLF